MAAIACITMTISSRRLIITGSLVGTRTTAALALPFMIRSLVGGGVATAPVVTGVDGCLDGVDPVEVAAVLMDGLDLVVLGLRGRSVPGARARAVTARARQKGCTLLVTEGDWPGASVRLDAAVSAYEVTGTGSGGPVPGCGRIGRVRLVTHARGRIPGLPRAHTVLAMGG